MSTFPTQVRGSSLPLLLLGLTGRQSLLQLPDLVKLVLTMLARVHCVSDSLCPLLIRHVDEVDLRSIL